MPELQEAPENMLFCSPERCHLGAGDREAEHGDKAHDKQFAKVVTRVVGPGIGDVVEGGEKDVHAGNGLQKDDPHPRIHPRQNSNAPQIRSNPKRDSPEPERANVAKFYSARSNTIPPLPWQTFALPFSIINLKDYDPSFEPHREHMVQTFLQDD